MLNVVVIDDRVTNRNILTRLAMSVEEGIRVKAFASPKPALAWLEQTTPDLVITDFKMPDMDGADFIRAFRALPGAGEVPVMVVTVYEERSYCYQALEAGATDFLLSPVDQLEFRARARNLLTMRKQQKLLEERAAALHQELSQNQERLALPTTERRLRRLIDSTLTLINAVDRQGRFTHVNDAHRRIYGVNPTGVIGHDLAALYGADGATLHQVQNAKVFETGEMLSSFEQEITLPDGIERRVLFTSKSPLFDDAGQVIEVITASIDITALKKAQAEMRRRVDHDPLTDLPNRNVYRRYVENALKRARRREARCAVLLVDLDRFKGVNDAFGLVAGDQLLKSVADRLASCLRESDVIGHLGGDEFVILQTDIRGPEESQALARRLGDSFGQPFVVDDEEIHISASIGITLFPADGPSADRLLKNAELAMYRAKAIGRNASCFYSPQMNLVARRTGLMER
ncbi:MAG: diguanylate cyclase, partial [Pseudomonadota bacterium]